MRADSIRRLREHLSLVLAFPDFVGIGLRGRLGVLILTDMFGGTPTNLGLSFLETDRVEVVTGVNLAMLIKLARVTGQSDLFALAQALCEDGRAAIRVASDLLRTRRGEPKDELPE